MLCIEEQLKEIYMKQKSQALPSLQAMDCCSEVTRLNLQELKLRQ
jgi:hypothetical protein